MKKSRPYLLCLMLLLSGAGTSCSRAASGRSMGGVEHEAGYLPLSVGRKWVLRSATVGVPVVLEVVDERQGVYTIRFDNPWINSVLRLRPQGDQYYLESVSMGGGPMAPSPPNTLYYDLGAAKGATWKNSVGTLTVTTREKVVQGRQHTFNHCVQIRETNKEGHEVFWTFAPGIGFVQFGEGSWAFVLDNGASAGLAGSAEPAPPMPPPRPGVKASPGAVLIGLSANPFASEAYTPDAVRARFEQSLSAGVTYIYLSPKWNELEPKPRNYEFKNLDFQIAQSVQYNVPAILNVRVVDTNQRAMPADLMKSSFRDPQVQARLLELLQAIAARLKGRVRYMMIGNEIDAYFSQHKKEVEDYRSLFRSASEQMKRSVPHLQVSTTITFDGLGQTNSSLKPLMDESDFFSVTYYPMSPDFRVREPNAVDPDMAQIVQAARGKKILLQEVGCPSSPLNSSSEDKQAQVFASVLAQIQANREKFIGANFFLMSDLSDSVVSNLAGYYGAPNVEQFKAFLKTLGMFDSEGRPKKSWNVFREKAPAINQSRQ
jgi:hypothetical protein